MRIWLIAENWSPRVGGIENYLTGIAEHLKGHEVTVITPTLRTPSRSPLSKGEKYAVIRKRFSWKPLWPAWLPLYLFLSRKAKKERPDVIICGKALMEGRIAVLLKKKYNIPFVICTYGMEIASWSTHPRIKKQLAQVLQDAARILYINKKTKQELIELGIPEQKLSVLYPGITPALLDSKNNPDEVMKRYGITQPYILCVARLVGRKGIADLIEAYSLLDAKVSLVIVGDGTERKNLEKHSKNLGVNPIFTGSISDEDLHALYERAEIFTLTPKELPGDYEGFGIVYCEAAYFELPVVGTYTGGVPEAVENNVTGILAQPNHPKSIKNALQKLLENPDLAKQYGQAGKQRVLQKFQWETIITQLTDILKNV